MRPRPEGRGERYHADEPDLGRCGFNAATTRRPWRTAETAALLHRFRDASMRPRPEGRGEHPISASSTPSGRASMRPRPEGRGELTVPAENLRYAWRCFNAATTRRPWRTAVQVSAMLCFSIASMRPRPEGRGELRHGGGGRGDEQRSFNAATTRRPWRTLAADAPDGAGDRASMRPRPEGRGEPSENPPRNRCPPRFNAATTRRPWRTHFRLIPRTERMVLQCGHDPKAVENSWPRSEPCRLPPVLQCGHDPKAVENRLWKYATTTGIGLQCGHDPKAVENYDARNLLFARRSFNAATTRRPWRTPTWTRWPCRATCVLQCGHDPKAVENHLVVLRSASRR